MQVADANFRSLLIREFAPHGSFSEIQLDQIEHHYQLMMRWNDKLNLTRILDIEESVRFHYCESLYLAKQLPPGRLTIGDIGSGAGFPGIPIAIMRPDCEIYLIEAHHRKAVFLKEATAALPNVHVHPIRAEKCGLKFDWVVSRAVRMEDVLRFGLAPNLAILGSGSGSKLPWGHDRYLQMFHVER